MPVSILAANLSLAALSCSCSCLSVACWSWSLDAERESGADDRSRCDAPILAFRVLMPLSVPKELTMQCTSKGALNQTYIKTQVRVSCAITQRATHVNLTYSETCVPQPQLVHAESRGRRQARISLEPQLSSYLSQYSALLPLCP